MRSLIYRHSLCFLFLLLCSKAFSQTDHGAHQPYSSYWFVDGLLKWNKDTDPHARFNVSKTPLAGRFVDPATQINAELSTEPAISSLVASHPTSNHPSQGFRTVQQYAFPYWQYIDYFVQWGGSAGEGIIVTPALPWIDAAHRNGVSILGTVFFPPVVYGGKMEWVREFLQKDADGNFPVADKLLEVAGHYGFEGWFINQETHGLDAADAENMQDFLKYYQNKAQGRFKIMWYDAMIDDGRIVWQEELNHHNAMYFQKGGQRMSDIMFIDFGWSVTQMEDSHRAALEMDRSPWELFSGIDVQSRGYQSFVPWKSLYKDGKPYTTSIGLYWPNATFDLAKDKQPETVYQEEQKFWNGTTPEAKVKKGRVWEGFTRYFPARSVIDEVPFVTHFNYGLGRFYNEKGQRLSDEEWHNLSSQDILPTWQWHVDTTQVGVTFDFNESYTGGSSVRIDIRKGGEEIYIPLYKTRLALDGGEGFELAAKGTGTLKLSLTFSDGSSRDYPVELQTGWDSFSGKLGDVPSANVVKIGVKAAGDNGQHIYLGRLGMTNGRKTKIARPGASIELFPDGDKAEMYIHIKGDKNVRYHSIYQLNRNGGKTWLGQTSSEHYYVPAVMNRDKASHITIQVVSIAGDGTISPPSSQKIAWK